MRPALDPSGLFRVDFIGNANLVAAASRAGSVRHFVLVTSIGADDLLFPLNLAWGVLFWKKRGEEALQRSGLRHTIVRPGGLRSEGAAAPVVLRPGGTFGLRERSPPEASCARRWRSLAWRRSWRRPRLTSSSRCVTSRVLFASSDTLMMMASNELLHRV